MIAFLRPSGLFIYIYMLYSKIHSSERCTHRRHTTTSFEVALRGGVRVGGGEVGKFATPTTAC